MSNIYYVTFVSGAIEKTRARSSKWVFFFVCLFLLSQTLAAQTETAENPNPKQTVKETAKEPSSFEQLLKKELNEEENQKTVEQERPSWAWQFIKTLLTLGILLVVFYGAYKVMVFRKNLPMTQSEVFQVLYEFPLMPGKKLQIVELGGTLLVLGVSDAGIQLVSEIKDKHKIDNIRLDIDRDIQKPRPDFFLELTGAVKNKLESWLNPADIKETRGPSSPSDIEGFRNGSSETLKRLRAEKERLRENGEHEA